MKNRSPLFLFSAALGSCLVLLACMTALGFAAYYVSTQANLAALFAPSSVNRIVFIGNDSNIYTIDPKGANKTQLTKDADGGTTRGYDFPTWAPDDRRIAFVGVSFSSGNPSSGTLYSVATDGTRLLPLYKSEESIPFYLYWSPDAHFVTFLAPKSDGQLALGMAQGDKENSEEELDSGAPLYFAWSPDSQQMLLHVGGALADSNQARIALLPLAQKNSKRALTSAPGAFAAPQWSPDGKHLLFSTSDSSNRQSMAVSNASGEQPKLLYQYNGRISFTWSPTEDRIAYIVTDTTMQVPNYGIVHVVDADGRNAQDVSTDPALAFFWSPNGKRIAYLTVQISSGPSSYRSTGLAVQGRQQIQMQWKMKDLQTGATKVLANFSPTDSFVNLLPFYDQYARSLTFWSPDSQSLVYTQSDSATGGSIWIASIEGSKPVKIGEGVFAAWSWK